MGSLPGEVDAVGGDGGPGIVGGNGGSGSALGASDFLVEGEDLECEGEESPGGRESPGLAPFGLMVSLATAFLARRRFQDRPEDTRPPE